MIEVSDNPSLEQRTAILDALIPYNERAGGPPKWQPMALLIRDGAGGIGGGLWGYTLYDWLFVELLVVPEAMRGAGLGTRLMGMAEDTARAHGCDGIWLDTFSFQARPFYEKLGFHLFGELKGHPRGGTRYFMQKRLSP